MKNIIGVDSTYLSGESLFLLLDKIGIEVKHLKANRVPCYKNLEELDLNKECTIIELFNALPNNCRAQFELTREHVNLATKIFKKNESVAPAILHVIKSDLRASFELLSERGVLRRSVYGYAKNDTGWTGFNGSHSIYTDALDVGSIGDFNYAGRYYLPRTTSSKMIDFPTDWDCFLDIIRYRDSHYKYTVTSVTSEAEEWVRTTSLTTDSGWKKK